jgi:phosphatidylglycerol:prolipoprotein diacylglycerol transferase
VTALVAAIPYRTFPTVSVGPVDLHTFGLFVAAGMAAGTGLAFWLMPAAVDRDQLGRLVTRLLVAGLIGARLAWVITHAGSIGSPWDLVAIWRGGLQFSGGFLTAVAFAVADLRRWPATLRTQIVDRLAAGLALGVAIGRMGCYAVGEHLGDPTGFVLATRYLGGGTREGPIAVGVAVHNTALYETLHLLPLTGLLVWILRRSPWRSQAGVSLAVFCLWYGTARFATDFLRAYDDTVAGLTGAQWMCIGLVATGAGVLLRQRLRASAGGSDDRHGEPAGRPRNQGEAQDGRRGEPAEGGVEVTGERAEQ